MIEPVLRRAPQQRAPSESTAAFLRSAEAEANLLDSTRPRLESSAAAGSRSSNSRSESAQEELYMQQVQDALREGSPDVPGDARSAPQQVQKRPTSKLAPRRQRPVSPAQQVQQDLSERYCCMQKLVTLGTRAALQLLHQMHVHPHAQSAIQTSSSSGINKLDNLCKLFLCMHNITAAGAWPKQQPQVPTAISRMLHCIATS